MKCPRCSSERIKATATNGHEDDRVTRKRGCDACGHVWFTVELEVPRWLCGWTTPVPGRHGSKPIARVPVSLSIGTAPIV
jgi:hypothetical protein